MVRADDYEPLSSGRWVWPEGVDPTVEDLWMAAQALEARVAGLHAGRLGPSDVRALSHRELTELSRVIERLTLLLDGESRRRA